MSSYFESADDMAEYYNDLVQRHEPRVRKILNRQNVWDPPEAITPGDERVIFQSNEPKVATRMILFLATSGKLVFKGVVAPELLDSLEPAEQEKLKRGVSAWERALISHYVNLDYLMFQQRRNSYIRQLVWFAAVHGWTAGVNWVQDESDEKWPLFSDVWNPLTTFNDLDSDGIFHVTKMTVREIERAFGPDRQYGPIKGYSFDRSGLGPRDKVDVVEFFSSEEHGIMALDHTGVAGARAMYIKPLTEHRLGHNPAWCNPVDPVPFDITTTSRAGEGVEKDAASAARWLGWWGQSPIDHYANQAKVLTQMAAMIQDKIAKWAKDMVIVQSANGSFKTVTTDELNQMDPGDTVQVIQPGKFPADDRAWIAFIKDELEKGSFPRAAYGIANQEAQSALQILKQASGPIVDPVITELTRIYQYGNESFRTQLRERKAQYKKAFPLYTTNTLGRTTLAFVNLSELPDEVYVTTELRGAGPQEDRFQKLLAVTNAANARNPILTDETLLAEYLDMDAPEEEIAKRLNQQLTSDPTVVAAVAPIWTALNLADKIRVYRDTPRGKKIADMLEAVAMKSADDLQKALLPAADNTPPAVVQATPDGAMMGTASGEDLAAAQAALDGSAQVAGAAPVGAPPAGSFGAATGPAMNRGAEMAMAANTAPPPPGPMPM